MTRPNNPSLFSLTPFRLTPFQWLVDGFQQRGARDAVTDVVHALVSWSDADAFVQEAVGFTTWDGVAPTLSRVLPLRSPFSREQFCDEYTLAAFGAYESRSDFNVKGADYDNVPAQDWIRYALTFISRNHAVLSDADLKTFHANFELRRYCEYTRLPNGRFRVRSGFVVEYLPFGKDPAVDGNWERVPEQLQAIPDWTVKHSIKWLQIPIAAVPDQAILDCLNCVNNAVFQFVPNGRKWQPGELLFEGLSRPVEMYTGPDGGKYADLEYLWQAQPGPSTVAGFAGWNTWVTRDPANNKVYQPMRVRGIKQPSFLPADFTKLFKPGA